MIRATVICTDEGPSLNTRMANLLTTTALGSGNSGMDVLFGNEGMRYMIRFALGSNAVPIVKSTQPGSSWLQRKVSVITPVNAWDVVGNYEVLLIVNNGRLDAGPQEAVGWAQKAWAAGREMVIMSTQYYRDYADLDARIAVVDKHHIDAQDLCNAVRPNGAKPVRLIPIGHLFNRARLDPNAPDMGNGYSYFNNLYGHKEFTLGMTIDPFHVNAGDPDVIDSNTGKPGLGVSGTGLHLVNAAVTCHLYGISPHLMPLTLEPGFKFNIDPAHGRYNLRLIYDVFTKMGRAGVDTSGWVRP